MQNAQTKLGSGWADTAKIVKVKRKDVGSKISNSEIIETKEYEVFNLDKRNRPISENKVLAFIKSFKEGHFFLKDFPAVVDDNFVILDGQHRLEACKRLDFPFYFRFSDALSLDNVIEVQLNAGWRPADYLHAYIQQKKMDYIILHRFVERYHTPISLAVQVLAKNSHGLKRTGFYQGEFKVKNESQSHQWMKNIVEISDLSKNIQAHDRFFSAMIQVMQLDEYDHKRMMSQMNKYGAMLIRQINKKEYLRNIEEVYNYKLFTKNKIRFT